MHSWSESLLRHALLHSSGAVHQVAGPASRRPAGGVRPRDGMTGPPVDAPLGARQVHLSRRLASVRSGCGGADSESPPATGDAKGT